MINQAPSQTTMKETDCKSKTANNRRLQVWRVFRFKERFELGAFFVEGCLGAGLRSEQVISPVIERAVGLLKLSDARRDVSKLV